MASIYRNSYTRNGQKRLHAKWYIKYRDQYGHVRRVPGHVDREEAEKLARELESHALRTLGNSLRDYKAYLRAKGDSWRTIEQNLTRVRAFKLSALTGAGVLRALPSNRQTAKHYLTTLRAYVRWAIRERIIDRDPISHISVSLKSYKPSFMRRALTRNEIDSLFTGKGHVFRGLSHDDRRILYKTALNTGFRSAELASLTPQHLTPTGLMLLSGDAKNRKEVVQPLSPEFSSELANYVSARPPDKPIWPGSWWRKAAFMLRQDCDCDADFHCLRVTYITELVRMGYYPKQVQMLARHSTMELTMRFYARLTPSDFNLSGLWQ